MLVKLFSLAKTLFLSIITATVLSTAANAFTDFDSKQTTIEDEIGNGKWTIVEVWASDCGACRAHMPDMVKFDGKLDNVRVLGIALDGQPGKAAAQDMIDEYKMPFKNILSNPIEMNAWMELNAEEGLIGTPTFMIFNPEGKLTALQPGILPTTSLVKYIEANS
ncbi:TlpA family protein disulfide reductase [Leucothrix arctica]|uniref:TlpA family protein disulfide reductase n=1 Tax=Leucothrix arctica TaxID=1481894 RepID=A0A317CNV4_9GAMM|nr:TlpA family protein disulfide reductase [Leucothrix arctica]